MSSYRVRRAGARNGALLAEAAIREGLKLEAAEKAAKEAEWQRRRKEMAEAEANRVRFTADDLANATHVRDKWGWHRVVRVSKKTVTVETCYSWTDRIPVERITQHVNTGKD